MAIAMILLSLTIIGIPAAWVIGVVTGIWVLYRIVRGWLRLADAQPMPSVNSEHTDPQ